ncbi:MAG: transcription elongation factor GreA [Candidatus Acetothermia bacterium]
MERDYENSTLLTEEGYERLSEKVEQLQGKIEKNREDMSRTADNGDLSENAGYMAAKESYQNHRKSLNKLQDVLSEATVISEEEIETDRVDFGTEVTVRDLDQDREFTYRIVGEHEARLMEGEISVKSPVAKGLLDREAGEEVEIETPKGETRYRILEIATPSEDGSSE